MLYMFLIALFNRFMWILPLPKENEWQNFLQKITVENIASCTIPWQLAGVILHNDIHFRSLVFPDSSQ